VSKPQVVKNRVMGLLGDPTKDHMCLSVSPHTWSCEPDYVDPSSLNAWSEEDGGLLHSRYESENTLNETYQEFDFLCNSVSSRHDCVSYFAFVGTVLALKLPSGSSYLDS